jgi:hypothetical protein
MLAMTKEELTKKELQLGFDMALLGRVPKFVDDVELVLPWVRDNPDELSEEPVGVSNDLVFFFWESLKGARSYIEELIDSDDGDLSDDENMSADKDLRDADLPDNEIVPANKAVLR